MKHFTGLAHIALYTSDLERSVRFYQTLGGRLTGRADSVKPSGINYLALVQLPGFCLEIIESHDGTEISGSGMFPHIAIQVDDINAAVSDLKAAGICSFRTESPMTMPIFGGIRNIFFTGPDGELLELLQPAAES